MLDPQAILGQARQGTAPAGWRVFTKARGRVRGFLRGTSADPDPLLVITPDGVAEYIDGKKSVATVDFGSLAGISLRVNGKTFSDTASRSGWMSGSTCTTATAANPSGARPRSLTGTRPSRRSSRPTALTRHSGAAAWTRADLRPPRAGPAPDPARVSYGSNCGRRPTLPNSGRWSFGYIAGLRPNPTRHARAG